MEYLIHSFKKSQNIAYHLSVSLSGQRSGAQCNIQSINDSSEARLTLINRPIYNSSVWDSSSSLHLSTALGSDSCLAGIHSPEGRAAIRLLTGWLWVFSWTCQEKVSFTFSFSVRVFSRLSSCHFCKPRSVSTCLHFSFDANLYCFHCIFHHCSTVCALGT